MNTDRHVSRAWLLIIALSLAASLPLRGLMADDFAVEGDAELLDLLKEAQLTNASKFPRGKLAAVVRQSHTRGGKPTTMTWDASVVWDEANTFLEYKTRTEDPEFVAKSHHLLIRKPRETIGYDPVFRRATFETDTDRELIRELRLRPDECWFKYEGRFDFTVLFELAKPESIGRRGLLRCIVTKEGDDRVVVERKMEGDATFRMVASLAQDGNIVAYDGAGGGIKTDGKYEWAQLESGAWRLKKFDSTFEELKSGLKSVYTMEVTSYNESADIPASRFEASSLDIPADAEIVDVNASGRKVRPKTR